MAACRILFFDGRSLFFGGEKLRFIYCIFRNFAYRYNIIGHLLFKISKIKGTIIN